jgi:hypothetical protein
MTHSDAYNLRKLRAGIFCRKHDFVKETYSGHETGDYVCIRCGLEISKKLHERIREGILPASHE